MLRAERRGAGRAPLGRRGRVRSDRREPMLQPRRGARSLCRCPPSRDRKGSASGRARRFRPRRRGAPRGRSAPPRPRRAPLLPRASAALSRRLEGRPARGGVALSPGAIVSRSRRPPGRARWPSSFIAAATSGSRSRGTRAGRCRARSMRRASNTTVVKGPLRRSKRDGIEQLSGQRRVPGDRVRGRERLPRAVEGHGRNDSRRLTRRETRRSRSLGLNCHEHGAIAQLGERLDRTQEVSGSNPLSSIRQRPWKQGLFVSDDRSHAVLVTQI